MGGRETKSIARGKDVKKSIVTVAVRIGSAAANYALLALVARLTGLSSFGEFSVLFSIALAVGTIGSFGQQIFLVKEVPMAQVEQDLGREKGAFIYASVSALIASVTGAAVFLAYRLGMDSPREFSYGLCWSCLLIIGYGISMMTIGGLRVIDRTTYAIATRDLLWRVLAMIVLFVAFQMKETYLQEWKEEELVIAILALTLVPIVADHLVRLLGHMRSAFRGVKATIPLKKWTIGSVGLMLVVSISSSDLYLYTILLRGYLDAKDVGAFFACLKTVELLNLFLMAVTLVVAPEISRSIAKKDRVAFQVVCNKAIVLQGVPCLAVTVLVVLFAPHILQFFDSELVIYANLLRFLAFGMMINALSGATVLILQVLGKQWRQVALQGGTLLVSLLLLPHLSAMIGIYGAAVSFIASKLVWNFLAIITIRSSSSVDPSIIGLLDKEAGGIDRTLKALRGAMP